jgi:hypothetical protein
LHYLFDFSFERLGSTKSTISSFAASTIFANLQSTLSSKWLKLNAGIYNLQKGSMSSGCVLKSDTSFVEKNATNEGSLLAKTQIYM